MPAPATPATQPPQSVAGAAAALAPSQRITGSVPRLPVSRQYKLGLCAVAIVMLLLPVIYLALTAAVAGAVCHFAAENAAMADSGYAYSMVLYFTLLFSGGLLVLFMLKPLFFKFWQKEKGFELRRADAPEFHAFVAEVSRSLGVPPPRTIRVDLQPNAGARFQRDLFSIRSEPILLIGLPLLVTLNVRQLAGIIAHEVCHLSQRTAMRLTWIIRTVNYWLASAVYGPHVLEDFLEWSSEIGPLTPVFLTAKFFIWITRSILWVLMIAGYSVSGYMLRQMEVDADRYAARVGGSSIFEEVRAHLEVLGDSVAFINEDLSFAYARKLMPDDLTPLVLANRDYACNAAFQWDAHVELGGYHRYLRTHPPDAERIANARQENTAGIVADETPALSIFRDFKSVSKKFTREWYRITAGRSVETSGTLPELLKRLGKDEPSAAAYASWFHLPPGAIRCIPLPDPLPAKSADELVLEIPRHAAAAAQRAGAWAEANSAWRRTHDRFVEGATAALLAEFVPQTSAAEIDLRQLEPDLKYADLGLQAFEAEAGARLTAVFLLLNDPAGASRFGVTDPSDASKLLAAATTLGALIPDLLELRRNYIAAMKVVEVLSRTQRLRRIAKRLRPRLGGMREQLARIQKGLGKCRYPFECNPEELTLRRYVLPAMPEKPDFAVLNASEQAMRQIFPLYTAVLGRCAFYAAAIEIKEC